MNIVVEDFEMLVVLCFVLPFLALVECRNMKQSLHTPLSTLQNHPSSAPFSSYMLGMPPTSTASVGFPHAIPPPNAGVIPPGLFVSGNSSLGLFYSSIF